MRVITRLRLHLIRLWTGVRANAVKKEGEECATPLWRSPLGSGAMGPPPPVRLLQELPLSITSEEGEERVFGEHGCGPLGCDGFGDNRVAPS